MDPVVVMDTILVVRPREVRFKWAYDRAAGTVSNTGNTWFKLLIKPVAIRRKRKGMHGIYGPGTLSARPRCANRGNHYIIYNDKFIKMTKDCPVN
ncbi:CFA/I fimbrial chaperone [Klebsiella michiganensis]|uniref:CFA/I fimbrial chaperone n=1 Tax=Klebsiella michiganensis TaxID=1134687 RepID=A0A7H4N6J6_9ENTR|nr:CFA/I fimbrial chaperone [Klebsiella michiganensis]